MFEQILNRKRLFLIGFFLLLFLILLLGDTFLKWYLYGLGGVFLLFYSKDLDLKKIFYYKKLLIAWLLFLIWIVGSFFWTASVSLTLDFFFHYLFTFLFFILFLSLPNNFFDKKEFSFSFLMIGLVLSLISCFFFFNNQAISFPGMNLIHSNYGHNHLSALLLFAIPLGWWWFFDKKNQHKKEAAVLIVFFVTSLVLSFGRTAILIVLGQFILIRFFLFRKLAKNNKLLLFFTLFLLALLSFKIFLSFNPSFLGGFLCKDQLFIKNICKPILEEARPLYWKQAINSFKDRVFLGHGAGTFELSSKKYNLSPWFDSNYAHNYYLKILSELGLIGGGMFIFILFYKLRLAFLVVKKDFKKQKNNFTINAALFMGVSSLFVDALLDFDWNFLGIFLLVLVFLAIVLNTKKSSENKIFKNHFIFKIFPKIFKSLSFLLVVFSVLFLITEIFTRTGFSNYAFSIFPYFHNHEVVFIEDNYLSKKQINKLGNIYKNNPHFYQKLSKEDPENILLKVRLFELDPWERFKNPEFISELIVKNEISLAYKEAIFWPEIRKKVILLEQDISYENLVILAESIIDLANIYYLNQDYEKAKELYLIAYDFNDWIFSEREIALLGESNQNFLEQEKLLPRLELLSFLSKNAEIDHFGVNRDKFSIKQLFLLKSLILKNDYVCCHELIFETSTQIVDRSNWLQKPVWDFIAEGFLADSEKLIFKKALRSAQKNLETLFKIWQDFSTKGHILSFEKEKKMAELFVELGNDFVFLDMDITIGNYLKSKKILPWIFTYKKIWLNDFELEKLETIPSSELEKYVSFLELDNFNFAGNDYLNSNLLLELVLLDIDFEDSSLTDRYLEIYKKQNYKNTILEKEIEEKLKLKID